MTGNQPANDARRHHSSDLRSAFTDANTAINSVTGSNSRALPPYVKRLRTLLSETALQAEKCEAGSIEQLEPEEVDSFELWELRRPGYLLEAAQHQIAAPRGWWALLPVAIAWLYLGVAEYWYRGQLDANPDIAAAGFFTSWISAPMLLTPAAMALVIVLTVLVIIGTYVNFGRANRRADRVYEIIEELERKAIPLVRQLHAAVLAERRKYAVTDQKTAAALSAAAHHIETAVRGAGDFLLATTRLEKLGPALVKEIQGLHAALEHSSGAAAKLATQADRITTAVTLSQAAAANAEQSASQAETLVKGADTAVGAATAAIRDARGLTEAAAQAGIPMVDSARQLRECTAGLQASADAITRSSRALETITERLSWAIAVADGVNKRTTPHLVPNQPTGPTSNPLVVPNQTTQSDANQTPNLVIGQTPRSSGRSQYDRPGQS